MHTLLRYKDFLKINYFEDHELFNGSIKHIQSVSITDSVARKHDKTSTVAPNIRSENLTGDLPVGIQIS